MKSNIESGGRLFIPDEMTHTNINSLINIMKEKRKNEKKI